MLHQEFAETFGNRLRNARIDRDMKQTELGARVGASQSSIGYWEAGKRGVPLDKIPALCAVLRITPGYLFGAEPIDGPRRVTREYERFQITIARLMGDIRQLTDHNTELMRENRRVDQENRTLLDRMEDRRG